MWVPCPKAVPIELTKALAAISDCCKLAVPTIVNPTLKSDYKRSNSDKINAFREIITKYNIPSTIRMEKGIDINAGCGQLKSEFLNL